MLDTFRPMYLVTIAGGDQTLRDGVTYTLVATDYRCSTSLDDF